MQFQKILRKPLKRLTSPSSPTAVTHSTEEASTSRKTVQTEEQESKQVNFNNLVKIRLIPDRTELVQKNLMTNLWFEANDYPFMLKKPVLNYATFATKERFRGRNL